MHEFRRTMQALLKNKWREEWVTVCLILVSAGLVFSRAILSIASVAIVVPFFFSFSKQYADRKIWIALSLLILPVLISGFWSEDVVEWRESVLVRLPIVTMMTGCLSISFSVKRWLLIACFFIGCICIGCVWSIAQYAADPLTIQESYLRAKVLPTLADHDYPRFSWMVVVVILIAIKCIMLINSKRVRFLLTLLIAFFIFYLHLLAAKTGLICLYACALIAAVYLLCFQKKWKMASGVLLVMITAFTLAYQLMPTLRNRIQYVRYDFNQFYQTGSAPGYNDAARWLSVKAGYHLTNTHPLSGVGFGDMRTAVNSWHDQYHPRSLAYERFLPANEWIVYGTGSGWPGIICFTVGIVLLLYATSSRNIISVLLAVTALIPFITDDTFEGQLGVIILAFIAFFAQRHPSSTVPV